MRPPTHDTDRLILREYRGDDFEPMAAFFADPISQFYGGPCGRDDAWRKFAAYPGHWSLRGYGPWAIERAASTAVALRFGATAETRIEDRYGTADVYRHPPPLS